MLSWQPSPSLIKNPPINPGVVTGIAISGGKIRNDRGTIP